MQAQDLVMKKCFFYKKNSSKEQPMRHIAEESFSTVKNIGI